MTFKCPGSKKEYSLDEVLQALHVSVGEYPGLKHTITVASDSQRHQHKTVYITVIVLHHVGRGARVFYWKQIRNHRNTIDLSVRINLETQFTIEVLQSIEKSILIEEVGRDNLFAHIDAGHGGKSRKVVDSCMGWIKGQGFECLCKPDAFVATNVADRFTKSY